MTSVANPARFADLHLHTRYSDGTFTPRELVEHAVKLGFTAIAVTDHDTLDAIPEALAAGQELGLEVIPGVEITSRIDTQELHMLAYLFGDSWHDANLRAVLNHATRVRKERVEQFVAKLNELGVALTVEDVYACSTCGTIGRPHVALALVKRGFVSSVEEAFNRFLKRGKPAYVERYRMEAAETIGHIKRAGGVAVIAHPGLNYLDKRLHEMVDQGMSGIEVWHSRHTPAQIEHYGKMAETLGVCATGGSDCHGLGRDGMLLGKIKLPYERVEALKARTGKIVMGLFQKFRDGLRKTQQKLAGEITRIVTRTPKFDADSLEELEAVLISTDIGINTATKIIEQTREAAKQSGEVDVFAIARAEIERELSIPSIGGTGVPACGLSKAPHPPTVILMAGVNGTGKTTSTAKLAHWLKGQGNTVLLAACDTFRAAAIEQLKIWGQRVGCDVVAGQYGADSAAIAYDALEAAINRRVDYLIIDTAGRLHTKKHLMEEMKKMHRSLQKKLPAAPHEILLVLDSTTGSNALNQAREFNQALGVTRLVVTKLDGTAKGGIVVAIARELKIPVKFIGLGEQVDDLQPFDPQQYSRALFSGAD